MKDSKAQIKDITGRLRRARMRLLVRQGFFGLLLMHVKFGLDTTVKGAAASSDKIVFNPDFVELLSEDELDYCLNHQVMHIAMKHCMRKQDREDDRFWKACDIVVNSNILYTSGMDEKSIFLFEHGGVQPHQTPSGREGYECTVEEVYEELCIAGKSDGDGKGDGQGQGKGKGDGQGQGKGKGGTGQGNGKGGTGKSKDKGNSGSSWDDHSRLNQAGSESGDSSSLLRSRWQGYVKNAADSMRQRNKILGTGNIPLFAERFLGELHEGTINWRTILNEFVQEEINDYTFSPPDRRFGDSDFFLPDFNEKDDTVKNLLFWIDASASMSDDQIADCFSEIRSGVEQFGGKLSGWLGFFDAAVTKPIPFEDVDSLTAIRPKGGGGTSFYPPFRYMEEMEEPPCSIIIMTDGLAAFPPEKIAAGVPTLWVITGDMAKPPWGKVAKI